MNIYIAGPLGFQGAEKLRDAHPEACAKAFPAFFVRDFDRLKEQCISAEETEPSDKVFIREIKEGGLFAALWDMAAKRESGITVYMDRIPCAQETVEMAELFSENPYELGSRGAWLIFAETYEAAGEAFPGAGEITFIGRETPGKARKVIMPEGERFLTPPARREKDTADRIAHTKNIT